LSAWQQIGRESCRQDLSHFHQMATHVRSQPRHRRDRSNLERGDDRDRPLHPTQREALELGRDGCRRRPRNRYRPRQPLTPGPLLRNSTAIGASSSSRASSSLRPAGRGDEHRRPCLRRYRPRRRWPGAATPGRVGFGSQAASYSWVMRRVSHARVRRGVRCVREQPNARRCSAHLVPSITDHAISLESKGGSVAATSSRPPTPIWTSERR
jgi:hypothetical protein